MLYNIQVLRAIASLLVVFHHFRPHYESLGGNCDLLITLKEFGFIGVDLFFAISGFIMVYTTTSRKSSFKSSINFVLKRFIRVYSTYWFFCIIAITMNIYFQIPRFTDIDISTSLLLLSTDMKILLLPVSWSLSYELYFYLIFGFLILFRTKSRNSILTIILILLVISEFLKYFDVYENNFLYSHFLIEFFLGSCTAIFLKNSRSLLVIILSGFLAILLLYFGICISAYNGIFRILTFGLGCNFILIFFILLENRGHIIYSSFLKVIGDASYSIYLIHTMVIAFFYYSGTRDLIKQIGYLAPILSLLLIVSVSISLSILIFKYIENPLYKKSIKLFNIK